MLRLLFLLLVAGCNHQSECSAPPAPTGEVPPNVVVIVLDDLGNDIVGAYGESNAPPETPHIDALADQGMLFRNFYAQPYCSPTRAALLTGRHSDRFGLGTYIQKERFEVPADEVGLAAMLDHSPWRWQTAATGKWHVSHPRLSGVRHPQLMGFQHFAGSMANPPNYYKIPGEYDYFHWEKVTNGRAEVVDTYMTADTTQDAITQAQTLQPPFLLYVAFNGAHTPLHTPPTDLFDGGQPEKPTKQVQFDLMVESVDREVGRLVAALPKNTVVMVLGDNGTLWFNHRSTSSPFHGLPGKGSVLESGTNVPLIVAGPGIPAGVETDALAHVVDVFPTIMDIAGVDEVCDRDGEAVQLDGISFAPVLADPSARPRQTVYTSVFGPNGLAPYDEWARALRDQRYKLVRSHLGSSFHDLKGRDDDGPNLLAGTLSPDQQAAFDRLSQQMTAVTKRVRLTEVPEAVLEARQR